MMNKVRNKTHIAFCGFDCSECPVYIATQTNDTNLKIKLAKTYSTDACIFKEQDMICHGCKSMENCNKKMCNDCFMRQCCIEKGIPNCAQCHNYPCEYIEKYIPKEKKARDLLDKLSGK